MAYRNGNYTAFYVAEPFNPSSLGANATKDFQYYNVLRMWKGADATFPFVDSHDKTYSVRDGSDWEYTLKPRLSRLLKYSPACGLNPPALARLVRQFPHLEIQHSIRPVFCHSRSISRLFFPHTRPCRRICPRLRSRVRL